MKHWGRKLFHLLGGVGLLSLYFFFGRGTAFDIYGALIAIVLLFEISRLKIPAWNNFIYTHLGSVIRTNEKQKMTGTVPYILGIGLSLYAYSTAVASTAVCFLAFGDVAATTIGERFGKTKIGSKSLEGTAAFVAASLVVGFLLPVIGLKLAPWVMVLGAVAAACIELLPLSLNDNLMIPVLSGAVMEFAMRWAR
jgi:glycerol-3-phosphate acyltransferase PlsY